MIRAMKAEDLSACAAILCEVYNNELWQCRWSRETAEAYLAEYFESGKFVGYVCEEGWEICGAIFCHEKIWWNNSELFVDEMFVLPACQRKGIGTELLKAAETYIKDHLLAGFTLSTNRYSPAPEFYRKNGFVDAEHVLFMGKVVPEQDLS